MKRKTLIREPLTEAETQMLLAALVEEDSNITKAHAELVDAEALVYYHTRRRDALTAARDAFNEVMNRDA